MKTKPTVHTDYFQTQRDKRKKCPSVDNYAVTTMVNRLNEIEVQLARVDNQFKDYQKIKKMQFDLEDALRRLGMSHTLDVRCSEYSDESIIQFDKLMLKDPE